MKAVLTDPIAAPIARFSARHVAGRFKASFGALTVSRLVRVLPFVILAMVAHLATAEARPPLSASDWLSGSVQEPPSQSGWRPGDGRPSGASRKPSDLARTGSVEPVGVHRLGQANPDATGTVSPRTAGLPADLWGNSDATVLARLIQRQNPQLPALRRLMRRVLAAQLDAPRIIEKGTEGTLFLARVDKLLDMGATRAAQDLLQAAGPGDPQRFRRLFDIALLSGDEARACEIMDKTPGVAPSFAARIFCLALGGDWAAAALVHVGAATLGQLDEETALLMSHFLDDAFVDSAEILPPPTTVTPLTFRLHEAIGQPLPSQNLPLAFALSDLDDRGGWKAQLEAAERLARAAAIPASQLRDIYIRQKPAASGGVWDRAAAVQTLIAALGTRDRAAVAAALPPAYAAMNDAGLGTALADMVGAESAALELPGQAGVIAMWLALAANQVQTIEILPQDASAFDRWLVSFASGDPKPPLPPADPASPAAILAPAFLGDARTDLPENAQHLIAEDRRGEALLAAISDVDSGLEGNLVRAAAGLRTLRTLGQGDIARQAAVELMLAPRVSGLR